MKKYLISWLVMAAMLFVVIGVHCTVYTPKGGIVKEVPKLSVEPTKENAEQVVNEIYRIKVSWGKVVGVIKSGNITFDVILGIMSLMLISAYVLGIGLLMLIEIIKIFTPPQIDIKLDMLSIKIRIVLLEMPAEIIAKLRGKVRKDKGDSRI